MYDKILVAVDGSAGADKALAAAVTLAESFGAELYSIAVEGHLPAYAATLGEVDEAKAEKDAYFEEIDRAARAYAAARGVELRTVKVVGDPAERIIRHAEQGGFALLVLGHKGHSRARRFLLGSTSDKVVDHAPCSTLIVK